MNNEIKKPQPRGKYWAELYAPVPTFEEVFSFNKTAEPDIDADDDLDKVIFDSIIHIIIQYRLYQKKINF